MYLFGDFQLALCNLIVYYLKSQYLLKFNLIYCATFSRTKSLNEFSVRLKNSSTFS